LCDAGYGIDDDFAGCDQHDVDHPCACKKRYQDTVHHSMAGRQTFTVYPLGIDIGVCGLIERFFV